MRLLVLLAVMTCPAVAQQQEEQVPEPTQNPSAVYRLFRTQNVYSLLS